ncbi:MAG TPA: DUF4328 domain-containing protein [Candidatus Dormibacteraeota bacterium]|nr:DUF4328 domain-containing protein [Candidatus Dormibacteraeota bacterium]
MQQLERWLYDHQGAYPRSRLDGFRSAGGWSHAVLGGLCVWALAALLSFVAELGRLDIVDRISAGDTVSIDQASQSDAFVQLSAVIDIAAFVLTGIAFLFWLHRVAVNNAVLGALPGRFTPRSAVGMWFIPLVDLVMPLLVVREAWRAADPMRLHSTFEERRRVRVPWFVSVWWMVFLAASFVTYAAGLAATGVTNPLEALHNTSMTVLAGIGLAWIAALFAMVTVIQLTRRQEAKVYALELAFAGAAQPPPEPEVALRGVPAAHLQPLTSTQEA